MSWVCVIFGHDDHYTQTDVTSVWTNKVRIKADHECRRCGATWTTYANGTVG